MNAFENELKSEYDLPSDALNDIVDIFNRHSKVKTKRKPSAYNLFVKEAMNNEDIKKLTNKERLSLISKRWKELPENDKELYRALASKQNF